MYMKKLFRILLAGTFMFTFFTNSFSQTAANTRTTEQTKPTVEQRATKLVEEIKTVTTLTDDQATKITAFAVDFFKQKDADDIQNKGKEEALAKARQTRKTTFQANIKTVLTEEQFIKVKNYLDNKKKEESRTK